MTDDQPDVKNVGGGSLTVAEASEADRGSIGRFVDQCRAEGTAGLEHDMRWLDVLEKALGHRPRPLVARDGDGTIVAYLPLVLVASRLFGRFLVSLPYLNQVGLLAGDHAAAGVVMDEAVKLADRERVQYLELRHGEQGVAHGAISRERTEKVRMVLDLPGDEAGMWKAVNSKVRNHLRKAQKSELSVRWGGADLVPVFYNVFAVNMRDLGTPVYSRTLFEQILQRFPDEAEIAVIDYQGSTIAGGLIIHDDAAQTTQVPSSSTLRGFNFTNANSWLFYQFLLRAIERGSEKFDFGRSSEGSGTWRFKMQWGSQPVPTRWQYYLREGDMDAVRPDNPKYQRRIQTWQKLPVWLTRLVGPHIVKGIP